jgi:hypothetical protein
MSNQQIVPCHPAQELGDINAVAADREIASVLAGEVC